jgi:hypothetical protein
LGEGKGLGEGGGEEGWVGGVGGVGERADRRTGRTDGRCAPQPAASTQEVPSSLSTLGMHEPDPHPSRMTYNSVHTDTQRGVTIRVREGRSCHEFEITELDWSAVDYARFGPSESVDLVVSSPTDLAARTLSRWICLLAQQTTEIWSIMDRGDWPANWGELVSSFEMGVSFRAGLPATAAAPRPRGSFCQSAHSS